MQPEFMGVSDGLLIRFPKPPVVKGDSERLQTYRRELSQVHRVLAQNTGVHSLIEVNPPLYWNTPTIELGTGRETEITYFSDDLFEPRRGDNIVVHQGQILLWPVQLVHQPHKQRQRSNIALVTLQFRNAAETALPNTSPRCVSKIRIIHWVSIADLVQDAVVRNEVFDGRAHDIIGVQLLGEIIQLQGDCRSLSQQPLNETNAAPSRLGKEPLVHQ